MSEGAVTNITTGRKHSGNDVSPVQKFRATRRDRPHQAMSRNAELGRQPGVVERVGDRRLFLQVLRYSHTWRTRPLPRRRD